MPASRRREQLTVVRQIGVQLNVTRPSRVARGAPSRGMPRSWPHLLDRLPEQMGQQVAAEPARPVECSSFRRSQHAQLGCCGAGKVPVDRAEWSGSDTVSPRHNRRSASMSSSSRPFAPSKPAALSTKSFGCHPDATETPTRPFERLSTTAHSSATRTGECNGNTTLPARTCLCRYRSDGRARHGRVDRCRRTEEFARGSTRLEVVSSRAAPSSSQRIDGRSVNRHSSSEETERREPCWPTLRAELPRRGET